MSENRSPASGAMYNQIGLGYSAIRQADPRLAQPIWQALGNARSVINVGAGTGSYEPLDREVVAVEPSAVMIAQRPPSSAPAVQGTAECLPFDDKSFDAAMAVITLHHWDDIRTCLMEMVRVARRRVVVVTFDPQLIREQWIVRDYLPEALTDASSYPPIADLLDLLPNAEARPLLVPWDCTDRMLVTLWARPEEHLDPTVRAATSTWHQVSKAVHDRAVEQLRRDLASGRWDERCGHLRTMVENDVGLRLVCADLGPRSSPTSTRSDAAGG